MIDLLKTKHPLILTANISDRDLEPIDHLRKRYFPSDRNFLRAHLTMFHRLPGEYLDEVVRSVVDILKDAGPIEAKVSGLRHLGAGVAFNIDSPELHHIRARMKSVFTPWLGSQDMQKWQPHITIQNKVTKTAADSLYGLLQENFVSSSIKIDGVDLWRYLGGPWQIETSATFASPVARNGSG